MLAVIMITLSLGIGIGTYLQASSTGPTVPTTLAASATNRTTGASASIVVTGHGEGSHVEATFGGLQPGIQYQLFAVTVRAKTNVVTRWIGADSQTTVRAELNTRPQDLAFFTVTGMDGAVVVSVRLTADAATP